MVIEARRRQDKTAFVRGVLVAAASAVITTAGGAAGWASALAATIAGAAVGYTARSAQTQRPDSSQTADKVLAPLLTVVTTSDLALMSHQITAATKGQIGLIERMNDELRRLTAAAGAIAVDAEESAAISAATQSGAREGGALIRRLRADLEDVIIAAQRAVETIAALTSRVEEVGRFAGAIDGVARNIHLVALNANIEAARAGEHGLAFGVVAQEVQGLARQTAEAAGSIRAIVAAIAETAQRSTSSSEAMKLTSERMSGGLMNAAAAAETFDHIVAEIDRTRERIDSVAAACASQASSSEAVAGNARGVSAAAKATAESASELRRFAHDLESAVDEMSCTAVAPKDAESGRVLGDVAKTLRPLFDVPREHAGGFIALHRSMIATRGQLTASDLGVLDGTMLENLERFAPTMRGATVTAARDILSDRPRWMHWWVRDEQGTRRLDVDHDPSSEAFYDYEAADWYRIPVGSGRTWLSDPYFDDGGAEAHLVTISVPAVDDGVTLGVATADLGLAEIDALCRPLIGTFARPAALVSPGGLIVSSTSTGHESGSALDARLGAWLLASAGLPHADGPGGVRMSRISTLEWALLYW